MLMKMLMTMLMIFFNNSQRFPITWRNDDADIEDVEVIDEDAKGDADTEVIDDDDDIVNAGGSDGATADIEDNILKMVLMRLMRLLYILTS